MSELDDKKWEEEAAKWRSAQNEGNAGCARLQAIVFLLFAAAGVFVYWWKFSG